MARKESTEMKFHCCCWISVKSEVFMSVKMCIMVFQLWQHVGYSVGTNILRELLPQESNNSTQCCNPEDHYIVGMWFHNYEHLCTHEGHTQSSVHSTVVWVPRHAEHSGTDITIHLPFEINHPPFCFTRLSKLNFSTWKFIFFRVQFHTRQVEQHTNVRFCHQTGYWTTGTLLKKHSIPNTLPVVNSARNSLLRCGMKSMGNHLRKIHITE